MGECFLRRSARKRTLHIGYTYTGEHEVIDDGNGNWRIRLLTSGTLTFDKTTAIDAFLVGGGGGGGTPTEKPYSGGGGGGGYTTTVKNITATTAEIVVGDGGAAHKSGGNTTAFGYTANGGESGSRNFAN